MKLIQLQDLDKKSRTVSKKEYEGEETWGLLTSIDLQDCDVKMIRDAEKIKQFVDELCVQIEMKKFGECVVVDFGDNPKVTGFSMTQLIETSLISGHFGNEHNGKFAYLDIFSCKWYDQEKAVEFAKEFFKAKKSHFDVLVRGRQIE